ncbi:MAG: hypothetical protein ACREME_05345 [Gemmatimonadales bacterium]
MNPQRGTHYKMLLRRTAWILAILATRGAAGLSAQHAGHDTVPSPPARGPLGIPDTRAGSGTAWLPDASPMHAVHFGAGAWSFMVHGFVAPVYDYQGGPRGDDAIDLINWGMVSAMRPTGDGRLSLRFMASADPWTVGPEGYPLLLQSGEAYRGAPLVDRQHPHDLWVELAALWEQPLARNLGAFVYAAAVGEPAVGPSAYLHRPSAQSDPFAPLGHHWQDATHIAFGAVTAGLFSRTLKLEASAFNGREPDERRTDFDLRRLDSYSGRIALNAGLLYSLSAWYAYLDSPEELHPDESIQRFGAALLTAQGPLNAAFVWGANATIGGPTTHSLLAEADIGFGRGHHVFGRAEYVRKSAEDLAVAAAPPEETYHIGALAVGYLKEWGPIGIGARGSVGIVPASLEGEYGARLPLGVAVYARWRPR